MVWLVMFSHIKVVNGTLTIPVLQTASEVAFYASCGLITLFRSLGKQFHNDCRDRARNIPSPLSRRERLSGNVAVNPFDGIRSGERETAGQQFVKCDAEGVKIATRIDRTIHSSRLLGSHVGERSRNKFGRVSALALARQSRGNTETHQPGLVQSSIRKHVGRFYVFVDEATSVHLAECRSELNRTVKKLFQLHWLSKKPIEWLSVWILEEKRGPALLLYEGDWPNSPCRIELVLQ